MLLRSLSEYILKQLFFSFSANSGRIFAEPRSGEVKILLLFTEISKNNCNFYAFLHRKLYRKHRNLLKDIACDCGLPIYIFLKLIHPELLKKNFHPFNCTHGSILLFALTFIEDPSHTNCCDRSYHILCAF